MFIAVRNKSSTLSIPAIIATPSIGIFTAAKIIGNITRDPPGIPAPPIEPRVAVNIITI